MSRTNEIRKLGAELERKGIYYNNPIDLLRLRNNDNDVKAIVNRLYCLLTQ